MQPIRNSVVREQIRLKNEAAVKNREKQLMDQLELYKNDQKEKCDKIIASINQQKDEQIKQVEIQRKKDLKAADKSMSSARRGGGSAVIISFVSIFTMAASTIGYSLLGSYGGIACMIISAVLSLIITTTSRKIQDRKISKLEDRKEKLEEDTENEIQRLKDNAEADAKKAMAEVQENIDREAGKLNDEIQKMYGAADQQTVKELNAYDHEMNVFANNILADADKYSHMVDAIENVFKDLSAEVKNETLIKFDLKFKVTRTEVEFDCGRKQDSRNYNFFKEGFRELSRDYECEGLAKALLMLTKARISKTAPTMMMSFGHLDSEVTIHFKGVNPNGRPL